MGAFGARGVLSNLLKFILFSLSPPAIYGPDHGWFRSLATVVFGDLTHCLCLAGYPYSRCPTVPLVRAASIIATMVLASGIEGKAEEHAWTVTAALTLSRHADHRICDVR
jgi:hypothetical protein